MSSELYICSSERVVTFQGCISQARFLNLAADGAFPGYFCGDGQINQYAVEYSLTPLIPDSRAF